MSHVACRMLHAACYRLHVACCMSHVACRMLHDACCMLHVACCMLHAAHVVRPLVRVDRLEVHRVPDHVVLVRDAVAAEHVAARARNLERLSGVG